MKDVKLAIAHAYHAEKRVRLWLGNPKTGEVWNEEYDIVGRIGYSTGVDKVPLLINNNRSMGGGAILLDCVMHIVDTKTRRVLFSANNFVMPVYEVVQGYNNNYPFAVYRDGKLIANFKTEDKALRWSKFMSGERMCK